MTLHPKTEGNFDPVCLQYPPSSNTRRTRPTVFQPFTRGREPLGPHSSCSSIHQEEARGEPPSPGGIHRNRMECQWLVYAYKNLGILIEDAFNIQLN